MTNLFIWLIEINSCYVLTLEFWGFSAPKPSVCALPARSRWLLCGRTHPCPRHWQRILYIKVLNKICRPDCYSEPRILEKYMFAVYSEYSFYPIDNQHHLHDHQEQCHHKDKPTRIIIFNRPNTNFRFKKKRWWFCDTNS